MCRGGRGRGKRRYQECAEEVGGGGRGGIRSVQRRYQEVSGVCRGGRGRGERRYQECAEEVGVGGSRVVKGTARKV